jgi:antitoxin (DNA-binding transcriptional repressor) of toxin-antitoxin stability system
MTFFSARDLRTIPKNVWECLSEDGEAVITNNGKPVALMVNIAEGNFEETLKSVRQARAMIAFNSMRNKAAKAGFMSDEEIEAEIIAARKERRGRQRPGKK